MSYVKNLSDSLGLLLFRKKAIKSIARDEKATLYAVYTVLISSVASLFGILTWWIALFVPFIFLFKTILMHVIALLLGGKATIEDFFRPMGATHVAYWITAFPIIGAVLRPIIFLYLLPVEVAIIKHTHKLSIERSIIVVLLPFILLMIKLVLVFIYFLSLIIELVPFL